MANLRLILMVFALVVAALAAGWPVSAAPDYPHRVRLIGASLMFYFAALIFG
jgi:hypothetical protein